MRGLTSIPRSPPIQAHSSGVLILECDMTQELLALRDGPVQPADQPFVQLRLHHAPASGEAFAPIPLLKARVVRIGQRFAHDLAKLRHQPLLPFLSGMSGLPHIHHPLAQED